MHELVVSRGSAELVTLPLEGQSFRVGRAPTNDLAVPEPTVSRHQFELLATAGGWRLADRSGHGTMIDGKRYTEMVLQPGARVDLGTLALTLREQPAGAPQHTASLGGTDVQSPAAAAAERLELVGQLEDRPVRLELTGGVVTIGSDPANDLVLSDGFISAFHCRLVQRDGGWTVIDLKSTNGTWLNGVRVTEARLEPNVSLKLGGLRLQVRPLRTEAPAAGFCGMVSADSAMRPVFELIERAAASDETVLITGESGSGKELVAEALHRLSPRAGAALIPLNCSAITKDLLESELFGHEKGAFTGAHQRRRGLFEEADGGTLLLDEIGELALDLQAKLLRVLESGEIRPVGANRAARVDTRVLAATHRSLPDRVRNGEFREDLYYRINVIEIALPPLRERPADIPLLAEHFLAQATGRTRERRLSQPAMQRLTAYRFPGNVRELKHTITRAAILCPDDVIGPEHLTFRPPSLADRVAESQVYRLGKTLREVEIEAVRAALAATGYNQKAAARELGIARSTLIHKLEKYGIETHAGGQG